MKHERTLPRPKLRMRVVGVAAAAGGAVSAMIWLAGPEAAGVRAYLAGETVCGPVAAFRATEISDRQRRYEQKLRVEISRLERDGTVELFRTPNGDWWTPTGNRSGLQFGIAEHRRLPYGLPKPGDIVLDAGANVGLFTRAALDAGARLVVAIEPVPASVESLSRNFADEIEDGRVIVYPKGVWHEQASLEMYVYPESQLDSFVMDSRPESSAKPERLELPLTTIDDIVEDLGLARVDFIKMDIEGAERKALLGARQTLRRHAPHLAVATENLPDDPTDLPTLVSNIAKYHQEPGTCLALENGQIAPEVMFFLPAS